MKKFKSIKILFALLIAFVLIAAIIYIFTTPTLDAKVSDVFVKINLSKKANDNIVLIMIDDKSVSKIRYPWKRTLYADMFEFLQNTAKAKVILYDAIIVSPDVQTPNEDKKFFARMKNLPLVTGGFTPEIPKENVTLSKELMPLFDSKFDINIKDRRTSSAYTVHDGFEAVTGFIPNYLKNVKSLGSIYLQYDSDGIARIASPIIKVNGKLYPSLALIGFSKYTGVNNFVLNDKYFCSDDNCKTLKINLTKEQSSVGAPANYYTKWYVNNSEHYSHKVYSAIDIVESYRLVKQGKKPIVDINNFKDKIVFVGANANATALQDVHETSILPQHSGTDIIATWLNNFLENDSMERLSTSQSLFIIAIISLITFLLVLNFSLTVSSLSCVILFLTYFVIYFSLIRKDIILPIVTVFLIQIVALSFGYLYRFIIEDTKKKQIQRAMGKYISDDIMKNVVKNIDDIKLGGKRAELTILFADIRGFTSISEQLQPEEVTNILNEYFSEMEPIITRYKGVLNKFIGDAVLVIFGDPIYDKDHALNAVKCADAMLKRVQILQSKWEQEGKPKIEIGIGINTGEAFVGNIGSQNRLEYTVIGDSVNLANRVEGYNKVYKTRFLITHSTYQKVRNFVDVIKIKDVSIRGKAKKIDIYEVLKFNDDVK